jgi:hypothetical protein
VGAPRGTGLLCSAVAVVCLLLIARPLSAQDLDPRAYVHIPVNGTFLFAGFSFSHGGVLTDPTLPLTDVDANVETPSFGVARSFSLFGQTAQAFAALPYSWAQSGRTLSGTSKTQLAGLSDMRLRLSVLVRGGPAASMVEIAKTPRRTILGTSLTVVAPTGQFSPNELINLGTNRWAFKPEFAVSQPIGDKWLLDAYVGVWLFTANDSYYPGTSVRTQSPMGAFQAHLSYNVRRVAWAAFDVTGYAGGQTALDGVENDNRQSSLRLGATLSLPVGRRHSIKIAASTGAIVRFGSDFTSLSFAWQTGWVAARKPRSR